MQNSYAIGIDVGGTNTDIGLVRDDSKIVARRSLPTGNYALLEPYVQDIMDQIKEMAAEGDPEKGVASLGVAELTGIGMGAPNGNFYTGCVEWAPNLPIRGLLNFKEEFAKHTNIPFVLSNDANAAAYGEYVYGGAKGMDHFIMITLGTGVGGSLVVNGCLYHGRNAGAGEIGSIPYLDKDYEYYCSSRFFGAFFGMSNESTTLTTSGIVYRFSIVRHFFQLFDIRFLILRDIRFRFFFQRQFRIWNIGFRINALRHSRYRITARLLLGASADEYQILPGRRQRPVRPEQMRRK